MTVLYILLAILSVLLFFWQISNIISIIFGVPYVKTDKKIVQKTLELANLKKDETFYDLGCGNGDVLIEAAKFGANAIGFEISPYYYLIAKIRTLNIKNIEVHYKNIYYLDLSKADIIYCYLIPKVLEKLSTKFQRELKNGSRLISIGFPIYSLILKKKLNFRGHNIYFY